MSLYLTPGILHRVFYTWKYYRNLLRGILYFHVSGISQQQRQYHRSAIRPIGQACTGMVACIVFFASQLQLAARCGKLLSVLHIEHQTGLVLTPCTSTVRDAFYPRNIHAP